MRSVKPMGLKVGAAIHTTPRRIGDGMSLRSKTRVRYRESSYTIRRLSKYPRG
jgi:hypothetical protein